MRQNHVGYWAAVAMLLAVATVGAGCRNNGAPILDPVVSDTSGGGGGARTGAGGANPNQLPEIDEATLFGPAGLETIFFDYNSFSLRQDALAALDRNAGKLRNVPNVMIQIEGHCDERGTQEYNLALGEKRALTTREHLIKLGIGSDRIITISYGEEMPAVQGHDEGAWSRNRRCEFNKAM